MTKYRAPLDDMLFLIDEVLELGASLGDLPAFAELGVGEDLSAALLNEAARFAGDVLSPLRRVADQQPASCSDGKVSLTEGYAEALQQLGQGGWMGICADPNYGGQGLPELYGTAACEMWNSADMSLALVQILSSGAALTIAAHGSEAQKKTYLPKMHAGEWCGSMNLTEAGAGSDLGAMQARAEREGEHYRIYGQKIFITWGDHEASDNIVHLVLAKLPDAPEGSRGISLFIVPKYLTNADGSLGQRNDVYPLSSEHKLGIHGSPTCVMAFGEERGAIGYLLGEENRGLAAMFTMMNEARMKIGLQGVSLGQGAYQQALAYAREREQGGVAIVQHPDVRRMLLTMKSLNEAMRALLYSEALTMDLARSGPEAERPEQQARIDLMIPVIKAWMTELGQEVTSLGLQVHGGLGYIEETGAAQYYRDIRIAAIYEGTNGIQAADLVSRKLARDEGAAMTEVLAAVKGSAAELVRSGNDSLKAVGQALSLAQEQLSVSTEQVLVLLQEKPDTALAGAFDYLMQAGYLFGGWQLARGALVAQQRLAAGADNDFYRQKLATACFYTEQILPRCAAHAGALATVAGQLQDYPEEWL